MKLSGDDKRHCEEVFRALMERLLWTRKSPLKKCPKDPAERSLALRYAYARHLARQRLEQLQRSRNPAPSPKSSPSDG